MAKSINSIAQLASKQEQAQAQVIQTSVRSLAERFSEPMKAMQTLTNRMNAWQASIDFLEKSTTEWTRGLEKSKAARNALSSFVASVQLPDFKSVCNFPAINISKAAEISGVHPDTLRLWEKQGKIHPDRTKGGHRRYRLKEIVSQDLSVQDSLDLLVQCLEICADTVESVMEALEALEDHSDEPKVSDM